MNAIELAKIVWHLVEEYGPEVQALIEGIVGSLTPVEGVTHCGICGTECPAYQILVNGKKVFRGKCPTHGFRRLTPLAPPRERSEG